MKEKHLILTDYILCCILALAFSATPYYLENGDCKVSIAFCITIILNFIFFIILTYTIRNYIAKNIYCSSCQNSFSQKIDKFMNKKYHFILLTLIIFVSWLPTLIFLYPGTFINDTWGQLQQFINLTMDNKLHTNALFDHHPIFDTILMGLIIVPLSKLTGQWHIFIFIYVIIQALVTCLTFAYTIEYAYKKLKIGPAIVLAMLLMYCLLPIYPISVQTVSKDALFSWIFVLFVTNFIELVRSNGKILSDKKYILSLTILSVLCCLTKKVGVYVILLSLFSALIFLRKNKIILLIPILCSAEIMFAFMPFLITTLNITAGGKQEMFSIPFQQTARFAKYHNNDITPEEYIIIDKTLGINDLAKRYNPTFADPVKGYSEKISSTKEYIDYLKVWMQQGIRHPKTYFDAFFSMVSGWFSYNKYEPLMNMDWHNQLNTQLIPEWVCKRTGISLITATAYQKIYNDLYENPLTKIFLTCGFYASLIPAFVISTTIRKWKNKDIKYWLAYIPVFFSIVLGCYLSPVSAAVNSKGPRYLYPIIYTTPIFIIWCLYIYKINCKK